VYEAQNSRVSLSYLINSVTNIITNKACTFSHNTLSWVFNVHVQLLICLWRIPS